MSKQFYKHVDFHGGTIELIATMNSICDDYMAQGFVLTVRQLYYQLVARAIIPNTERSYKRVTGVANDARMAGLMDWAAIEDRTRSFITRSRWGSGNEILESVASQFHMDMWADQKHRAAKERHGMEQLRADILADQLAATRIELRAAQEADKQPGESAEAFSGVGDTSASDETAASSIRPGSPVDRDVLLAFARHINRVCGLLA